MKLCDDCGGVLELANRKGSLDFFRCSSCGKEYIVHFSVSPEDIYALEGQTVEVVLDWERGQPSLKDVIKLRNLVPGLRDMSRESVTSKIESGVLSLGRYFGDQADDLVVKLRGAGLPAHARKS